MYILKAKGSSKNLRGLEFLDRLIVIKTREDKKSSHFFVYKRILVKQKQTRSFTSFRMTLEVSYFQLSLYVLVF